MIQPTVSDIGRRVVYDARPILPHVSKGVLVGIVDERCVEVLFDGSGGPLRVISNLKWADAPSSEAPPISRAEGAAGNLATDDQ